jgi:hypothetical protein
MSAGTTSPYSGLPPVEWKARTKELLAKYPLSSEALVAATLAAWESIFKSSIGGFYIGSDIFPKPQIMGFFMHELVPLELSKQHPGLWREDRAADEKDLVYIPDIKYSAEIKTSSHPTRIFGNRSYAQEGNTTKKSKSGYYLAINFEPFSRSGVQPKVVRIRFGWLDHADWSGQKSQTGQQSSLSLEVEAGKLIQLYPSTSTGSVLAPLFSGK